MHSYECKSSRLLYNKWKKYAADLDNVKNLKLGHIDLTPYYFEGLWAYWTPLTRFYDHRVNSNFEYYYEDQSIKALVKYFKQKSLFF